MIALARVEMILQPWLGARLSQALFPVMEEITALLGSCAALTPPDSLAARLDSMLFLAVRDATQGTFLIRLDDGGWVRVRVEDFAVMADELLLPLFEGYPADERHLQLLREYSMRQSSLSALRVLYTRYAPLQSPEELGAIADVARSCHPAFRLRGWLDP